MTQGRWRWAILAVVGALAALGQAPWGLWPVALVAFACGIILVSGAQGVRAAFGQGWFFGTLHFAVALHWIVEPFFVDAKATAWMAPFALVLLAGGLALFWGVAVAIGVWIGRGGRWTPLAVALALAGAETLRGVVFTGFPWAMPGHVLIASPIFGLASWLGPSGLTLAVLGPAAVMGAGRARWIGLGLWAGMLAGGQLVPDAPAPRADAAVIRLVQPNAPQHLKWLPDQIPVFFRAGLEATAAAPSGPAPTLVIWPETSLPELLNRSQETRRAVAQASGPAQVLVGAQAFGDDLRARNVAALLRPDGDIAAVYEKHHLVPFGEYLPLQSLFDRLGLSGLAAQLAGGYRAGPGPQVMEVQGIGTVFPMICYEAIFPQYIRSQPRPALLVHLTNDAWFGDFAGPAQHLALARLRAAEQGLPLVRAANTGISAIIDARGRVVASLALNTRGALDGAVPPAMPTTFYAKWGDWPWIATILVGLSGLIAARTRFRVDHPPARE